MGIHDFAHGSEAKRAYHRLALKWHPDRQGRAPEHSRKDAEDRFKARSKESMMMRSMSYSRAHVVVLIIRYAAALEQYRIVKGLFSVSYFEHGVLDTLLRLSK